jgi:uncharacterized repeat protein (TIGR02543 family)
MDETPTTQLLLFDDGHIYLLTDLPKMLQYFQDRNKRLFVIWGNHDRDAIESQTYSICEREYRYRRHSYFFVNLEGKMDRFKKVVSVVLILVMVTVTGMWTHPSDYVSYGAENTVQFAGGDGTAGNPYKISTPAHLYNVRSYLNNTSVNFILINDIVFTPEHFDSDPDNQPADENFYNIGYGWDPIGNSNVTSHFKGVFDGNNFTIKGMSVNRNRWDLTCVGLFGYNQGTIKNLTISNCTITTRSSGNVGSVTGINAGIISNCTNTNNISIPSSYAPYDVNAGGIAGSSVSGIITNCKNSGNVTINAQKNGYAGGIAGYTETGVVSQCVNTGNIFASVEPSDWTERISGAGGITGRLYYTNISDSYNVGNAISVNNQYNYSYAGGIAGRSSNGSISRCLTAGYLAANGSGANYFPSGTTCTNCFYMTSDAADANTKALTKAEFANVASFTGFDFSTVWEMSNELERPVLVATPPTIATSISFDSSPIILKTGQTIPVPLVIEPTNGETNYDIFSSNPAILGVNSVTHILIGSALGSSMVTVEDLVHNRTISKESNVAQPVTSLVIQGNSTVDKGRTITLQANVLPEDAYDKTVIWESKYPETATINQDGVVTGVRGGMTIIYATANFGATGTNRVSKMISVIEHPEAVEISAYETYELYVGDISRLFATVTPSGAGNKTVTWVSSNTNLVTVDSTGGIIGKAPGTATITVTTNDGGIQDTCLITVKQQVQSISLKSNGMNLREYTLAPGASLQLESIVKPADVETGGILWTSSDSSIVAVDEFGLIQAMGTEGSATINATAASGGKTVSCLIQVGTNYVTDIQWTPPSMVEVGKTYFVPLTFMPEGGTAPLWKSSDETVATVDAFGRITGVGPGTAEITIAASDAGGWSATFALQVSQVFPIRYNLNGGDPLPSASDKYFAPQSFTLPIPTKEGHSFVGWYQSADLTGTPVVEIPEGSTGKKTYYAKWQTNTYQVTFHHLETGTTVTQDVLYGTTVALPSVTRTGYTFAGWKQDPELYVYWNYGTSMPAQNIDLYTKWEPIYYYLDCGNYSGVKLYYDQVYTLPLPSKKPGFVFQGWGTSVSGPAIYGNQQAIKNLTTQNDKRIDLYEIWTAPILSAVSAGYDRATITWAAAESATSYRIDRSTSATGTYTTIYTAPATARSWTNTGLVTGKTYYYKVTTVAGANSYGNSVYKSVRPIPATPTVSLSKASTTSIKVTWSAVAGATKYQVYRATSATGTYTLVYIGTATTRSWTNTALTTKKTYFYKVRAYHLEGTTNIYGNSSSVKSLLL